MMNITHRRNAAGIILFFAVITFGLAACAHRCGGGGGFNMTVEQTEGRLIIYGIPNAYNGNWVFADLEYANDPAGLNLMAAAGVDDMGIVTIGQIIDGNVTLHVWRPFSLNATTFVLGNFTGSVPAMNYEIHITSRPTLAQGEYDALRAYISAGGSRPDWLVAHSVINPTVHFSAGIGAVSAADIIWR